MDEDVRAVVLRNESEAFLVVKPLHRSGGHGMILLAWDGQQAATHERRIIKKPQPAERSPMRSLDTSRALNRAGDCKTLAMILADASPRSKTPPAWVRSSAERP